MTPEEKLRQELLEQAIEIERNGRVDPKWHGEERRHQNQIVPPNEWQWLHTELQSIKSKVDATHLTVIDLRTEYQTLRKDFDAHMREEEKAFKLIKDAFPNGDFQGHLRYHEMLIDRDQEEKTTMRELKRKFVVGGTWGAVIFIGLTVWEWVKAHLK